MNAIGRLRQLDHVAVIGASERAGSEAELITANLLAGTGSVLSLINPQYVSIGGRPTVARIADLVRPVDLAVVLAPWATVPRIIDELGAIGCRLAMVMSRPLPSFFSPSDDPRGLRLLQRRAAEAGVRVIGPAAAGFIAPLIHFNASRASGSIDHGGVALLTANHAIFHLALDHAQRHRRGFSLALDLGAALDLDWTESIDFLARHEPTRGLLLATSCMTLSRSALSALRAFSARKPVLALNVADLDRPLAQPLYRAALDRLGIASTATFNHWIQWQPPAVRAAPNETLLSNSSALAALIEWQGERNRTDQPGALPLSAWLDQCIAGTTPTPKMIIIDPSVVPDRAALEAKLVALWQLAQPIVAWCGVNEDATRRRLLAAGVSIYADPQAATAALALDTMSAAARSDAKLTPPPLRVSLPWTIAALPLNSTRAGKLGERELRGALAQLNISQLDDPLPAALALDIEWRCDPDFGSFLQLNRGGMLRLGLLPLDLKAIEALLATFERSHDLATRWLRDGLYALSEIFRLTPALVQLKFTGAVFNPMGIRAQSSIATRGKRTTDTLFAPYPDGLEERIDPELKIRPIRGEDEPELSRSFNRLTPEEVRMRFHYPLKALTHDLAAELSQIDYDRQMAFILTTYQAPGLAPIFGVARLSTDPIENDAEFAIVIGRDYAGRGFGRKLLQKLIDHARASGLNAIWGDVLHDNQNMLGLAGALGFRIESNNADATLKRVVLKLT